MNIEALVGGTIRILKQNGATAGTGFVVSSDSDDALILRNLGGHAPPKSLLVYADLRGETHMRELKGVQIAENVA